MTVIEIVEQYLEEHGFDGLYNDQCGCYLKEGIAPCCGAITTCQPGYRIKTPKGHDLFGEFKWIVGPKECIHEQDGGDWNY